MPDNLFTRIVDEDGNESYAEVTEYTLDDDTFYADSRYRDVADRDKTRRLKYKSVVEQLDSLGFDVDDKGKVIQRIMQEKNTDPEQGKKNTDPAPAPAPEPLDKDALFQEFMERQKQIATEQERQAQERRSNIDKLMEKHNLKGESVLSVLMQSNDPDNTASELGRMGLVFDDTQGGQGDDGTPASAIEDMFGRINLRMGATPKKE